MLTEEFKNNWTRCLDLIRSNVGEERFNTWFACAKPVAFDGERITLQLPSMFFYQKYEDDFIDILSLALKKTFGHNIKLDYDVRVVKNDKKSTVKFESPAKSSSIKSKFISSIEKEPIESREVDFDPQLNFELNFENYCMGASNKLPVTVAEYIADNPGKQEFNPFFLYGSVGVGKTHLMQAIGIRIKERNPKARVLFIPMKQFQTLYAHATMKKDIPSFINWFQQMDVILFDDLQELSNKTGTAEALFPIFNYLQLNKKNIIFTCDRPPMELDGISDRLIDRFKWGIVEELKKPDFELRKKVLDFKSRKNGLGLPEDVINVIAENIDGSVRELENIVNGLLTRSIVKNAPISVELAKEVMSHVVKRPSKKLVNFDMIVEATAEYYNIDVESIFSKCRYRDIADARQLVMYLCHKHTQLSSPSIGSKLNRSHATVLHGISAIKDRIPFSKDLAAAVSSIEKSLEI